jgi:hypothetical protein
MDNSKLRMMADYADLLTVESVERAKRRALLDALIAMSHDHRYNLDTRLACMAQLLDDNRELWCRA